MTFKSARLQVVLKDGFSVAAVLMWLWEEVSTVFTYVAILTGSLVKIFFDRMNL